MIHNEPTEKLFFIQDQEENEGEYTRKYVLFLRFKDFVTIGVTIEDSILDTLYAIASPQDPYLKRYFMDIDEDIEEYLANEENDLLSNDKGDLMYLSHFFRIAFNDQGEVIIPPPAPQETNDFFEYIEKNYTKQSAKIGENQ